MREFWVSSGHQLTRRRSDGWLEVTDALLAAWLARPELVPPAEACAAERGLHARLRAAPAAAVHADELAALADPDAAENWRVFLGFRDGLVAAGSVEGAYLDLAARPEPPPRLLADQLVHLVMRAALDGCDDPFVLRAAELFWRPQRTSLRNGALLMTDLERAEDREADAHASPLFAILGVGEPEVMDEATADTYWGRSDAHDLALDWGGSPRSRAALATAIAAFLRHLMGIEARVEALTEVADVDFRWFVGLDADATALGNALWRGASPEGMDRLIGSPARRRRAGGRA
jgi:hypothetical protein